MASNSLLSARCNITAHSMDVLSASDRLHSEPWNDSAIVPLLMFQGMAVTYSRRLALKVVLMGFSSSCIDALLLLYATRYVSGSVLHYAFANFPNCKLWSRNLCCPKLT